MEKIILKKGKNITKRHIKKLLKDENTKITCCGCFTDDFLADASANFHKGEHISREWFEVVGITCLSYISQPRYFKAGYEKKSFNVTLGVSDVYTISNENIEWV